MKYLIIFMIFFFLALVISIILYIYIKNDNSYKNNNSLNEDNIKLIDLFITSVHKNANDYIYYFIQDYHKTNFILLRISKVDFEHYKLKEFYSSHQSATLKEYIYSNYIIVDRNPVINFQKLRIFMQNKMNIGYDEVDLIMNNLFKNFLNNIVSSIYNATIYDVHNYKAVQLEYELSLKEYNANLIKMQKDINKMTNIQLIKSSLTELKRIPTAFLEILDLLKVK